ncbi:MAG: hypothetical protein M3162_07050 [Thermoproteota archaeon]|nr:hypothetical protein [Thermoproteota archaeon]
MIRSMVSILVCPFDNESQLELFEIKTRCLEMNDKTNLPFISEKKSAEDDKEKDRKKDYVMALDTAKTTISHSNISIDGNEDGSDDDDDDDNDNAITIVEEGILFCNDCLRFYPIVDEIPIILPDELRDRSRDLDLLNKWRSNLPKKITEKALPWHL